MDRIKIVLFAANPFGDLKLDEEIRRIEAKLNDADRSRIELVAVPATRPGDLIDKLNQHRPKIVQFSGHGVRSGEIHPTDDGPTRHAGREIIPQDGGTEGQILLIGEDGKPKVVGKRGLVNLLRLRQDVVQIVVLNACYTSSQAEAIAEFVDCVIGTNRSINDEAARIFTARFYRSLAAGFSVATAFAEARIELELQGFEEQASIPQLWTRRQVDPAQIYLVPRGPGRAEPKQGRVANGPNPPAEGKSSPAELSHDPEYAPSAEPTATMNRAETTNQQGEQADDRRRRSRRQGLIAVALLAPIVFFACYLSIPQERFDGAGPPLNPTAGSGARPRATGEAGTAPPADGSLGRGLLARGMDAFKTLNRERRALARLLALNRTLPNAIRVSLVLHESVTADDLEGMVAPAQAEGACIVNRRVRIVDP